MADKALPPAERLRNLFSYDEASGTLFWLVRKGKRRAGEAAGYTMRNGYVMVRVDTHFIPAHRLIWCFCNGTWPADEIDHKNGVRSDNRIDNLREATRSENLQNHGLSPRNTSGFSGVTWEKRTRKWLVSIKVNKKRIHLGRFTNLAEAAVVRAEAKAKHHPFAPVVRTA